MMFNEACLMVLFIQFLFLNDIVLASSDDLAIVEFQTNLTNCKMFETECELPVLLHNFTIFNQFSINSDKNFKFFKFSKVLINNQSINNDTTYDAKIVIIPIVVGKDSLIIRNLYNDQVSNHRIVIISPDRLVDKIYYVYMFIFQILMSILMGILLTPAIMLRIVKTPLSVFVGFSAQYGFMPLVSL